MNTLPDAAANEAVIEKPKILLVDDEPNILNALKRLLHPHGYDLRTTTSPTEALTWLAEEDFSVIISDQRMPEMTGAMVLASCRQIHPETTRILLTGYSDMQSAMDAINDGGVHRFVMKPWSDKEICQVLEESIQQHQLVAENKRLHALTESQNKTLMDLNAHLEERIAERTRDIEQLNQDLKKGFLGSIKLMASLSEMHSPLVGSHSKRVAKLCKKIGERHGITGDALFQLEIAGLLHDIGKVSLPEILLSKPENLRTPADIQRLETHAVLGEQLVQMVPNLELAALYIRHHHEQFNGNGHPDRLREDNIPIGSRIIAVADLYDQALNTRASLNQSSPEKALKVVKSSCFRGELDPEIVELLCQALMESEGVEIFEDPNTEVEIYAKDLSAGMILSQDLITLKGVLLLPKNTPILKEQLDRIVRLLTIDPPKNGIYIYRLRQFKEN